MTVDLKLDGKNPYIFMSPNKSPNIIKYCVITSTTAIALIFISLIPLSKKAFYWNQCFRKTFQWIDKNEMELKNWDKAKIGWINPLFYGKVIYSLLL